MELFNEIKQIITEAEADAIKFYQRDNKAAGVRLRKSLQHIKSLSQDLRLDINKVRKERS
jgi:hypothetical protein